MVKKIIFVLLMLTSVSYADTIINEQSYSTVNFRVESNDFEQAFAVSSNENEVYFMKNPDSQAGATVNEAGIMAGNVTANTALINRINDELGFALLNWDSTGITINRDILLENRNFYLGKDFSRISNGSTANIVFPAHATAAVSQDGAIVLGADTGTGNNAVIPTFWGPLNDDGGGLLTTGHAGSAAAATARFIINVNGIRYRLLAEPD